MKFTSLLPFPVAVMALVICADDSADAVAPFEMLCYWTVYDLDVAVWGVHNWLHRHQLPRTWQGHDCLYAATCRVTFWAYHELHACGIGWPRLNLDVRTLQLPALPLPMVEN